MSVRSIVSDYKSTNLGVYLQYLLMFKYKNWDMLQYWVPDMHVWISGDGGEGTFTRRSACKSRRSAEQPLNWRCVDSDSRESTIYC